MIQPETDVIALARLARVEITDDAAKRLAEQLPRIIGYVGQLQAIPTEAVANEHPSVPQRTDEAHPSDTRDAILAAAPDREGDFWKVKAVL